jgi:hypothetical protein
VTGDFETGLRRFPDSLAVLTAAVCTGNCSVVVLVSFFFLFL